jgi:signal transduction histidine kinase
MAKYYLTRDVSYDRELIFALSMSMRQLMFACGTGALGTAGIVTIAILYGVDVDFRQVSIWTAVSILNLSLRLKLIYRWRRTKAEDFGTVATPSVREVAALLSGVIWGSAGMLFYPHLSADGQTYLIFALVALNFTGIPTLYSSFKAYLLLWAPTWLPNIILFWQTDDRQLFLTLALCVLASAAFVCFSLKRAIHELFEAHERHVRRVDSLNSDNEDLKMFFVAAHHDLGQPISAIQHAIRAVANKDRKTALHTGAIEVMESATTALTHLLEDIIHSERISAGISKADLRPTRLENIFTGVARQTAHLAAAKALRLTARPTKRAALTDGYVLERILRNLVENAIRYTATGRIVIAARPLGNRVSVEVWDTGVGIDAQDIDKIFEIYYRHDTGKQMHKGYGLGLAIVKRLAVSIDAEVHVSSILGKGSVFRIIMAAADDVDDRFTPEALAALESEPRPIEGMKVALLDDDPVLLKAVETFLRGEGATVVSGTTADHLKAKLADMGGEIDVLVTDWNLTEMTGERAHEKLAEIDGFSPAWIVISAEIPPDAEARLLANKIPVLHKPFQPSKLTHLISLSRRSSTNRQT